MASGCGWYLLLSLFTLTPCTLEHQVRDGFNDTTWKCLCSSVLDEHYLLSQWARMICRAKWENESIAKASLVEQVLPNE